MSSPPVLAAPPLRPGDSPVPPSELKPKETKKSSKKSKSKPKKRPNSPPANDSPEQNKAMKKKPPIPPATPPTESPSSKDPTPPTISPTDGTLDPKELTNLVKPSEASEEDPEGQEKGSDGLLLVGRSPEQINRALSNPELMERELLIITASPGVGVSEPGDTAQPCPIARTLFRPEVEPAAEEEKDGETDPTPAAFLPSTIPETDGAAPADALPAPGTDAGASFAIASSPPTEPPADSNELANDAKKGSVGPIPDAPSLQTIPETGKAVPADTPPASEMDAGASGAKGEGDDAGQEADEQHLGKGNGGKGDGNHDGDDGKDGNGNGKDEKDEVNEDGEKGGKASDGQKGDDKEDEDDKDRDKGGKAPDGQDEDDMEDEDDEDGEKGGKAPDGQERDDKEDEDDEDRDKEGKAPDGQDEDDVEDEDNKDGEKGEKAPDRQDGEDEEDVDDAPPVKHTASEHATHNAKTLAQLDKEITAELKADEKAVVFCMRNWLQEREQARIELKGDKQSISELQDEGNVEEVQRLDGHIEELRSSVAYLSDKLGVAILTFDSSGPFALPPAGANATNTPKKMMQAYSKKRAFHQQCQKLVLVPMDVSRTCGGLTKTCKLCLARKCRHSETHQASLAGTLFGGWAYFSLSGFATVHPIPVFCYTDFAEATITRIKQLSLNANDAANLRYHCNAVPMEEHEDMVYKYLLRREKPKLTPPPVPTPRANTTPPPSNTNH